MAPAPGLDLVESLRADVHLHSAPVDHCSELGAQSFKSRHLNMSVDVQAWWGQVLYVCRLDLASGPSIPDI